MSAMRLCDSASRVRLVLALVVASAWAALGAFGALPSVRLAARVDGDLAPTLVQVLVTAAIVVVSLRLALAFHRDYRRRVAEAAAGDERCRIARDLHDGLAQELAFIAMHAQQLAERSAEREATALAEAARHALLESRGVVQGLMQGSDERFDVALRKSAQRLAEREGADVHVMIDSGAEPPPEARGTLLRILHEAMANGLRHGGARSITVELRRGERIRLRIADDGAGFQSSALAANAESFGLANMTRRVHVLGGDLRLTSRPGGGTEVEVTLP
jgi:signal transduction histidine kinase